LEEAGVVCHILIYQYNFLYKPAVRFNVT